MKGQGQGLGGVLLWLFPSNQTKKKIYLTEAHKLKNGIQSFALMMACVEIEHAVMKLYFSLVN